MHDAGLHPRLREDRLDRFGETLQSVDAADQHVADAALLQLVQHREPELGALRALEPEPEHVPLAVEVDADRDVAGEVADGACVADLHDQRVEEEDRVDVLEPLRDRSPSGEDDSSQALPTQRIGQTRRAPQAKHDRLAAARGAAVAGQAP